MTNRVLRGSLWGRVNSLRGRLMEVVLLALVPFLGVILVLTVNQRRTGVSQATDNALSLARLAALDQERQIDQVHELLNVVSQLPEIRSGPSVDCQHLVSNLANAYQSVANLGVIDLNGDLVCSALPVSGAINLSDRTYFQRARALRSFSAGSYQIGRVTGIASLNFGFPVYALNGELSGVAFAALDLQSVNTLAAQVALPEGSSLIVVDTAGTILAHFPDDQGWIGRPIVDTELFHAIDSSGPEGTAEVTDLDGVAKLFGMTQLAEGDNNAAFVAVGIPMSSALAPADQTLARGLWSLGLAAVAGLAARLL
jgi:hypothetical protein